ncbi:hypothetical protein H6F67_20790 [Microcoleus sp. FACHB-1515]|uniref:hypothetical protein n=1 Tax=Cyanophyceae TaxID=3028117 RepID=UPI001683A8B3|nr:hypothetical protein [Microcoleus sp. FACHB-1515]MBD2092289.1 hypothetical protein [Microcoleus sp. FACHB-1515]
MEWDHPNLASLPVAVQSFESKINSATSAFPTSSGFAKFGVENERSLIHDWSIFKP